MNCINNFNALCFFRLLPTLLLLSLGIPIVQAQCPTDPALLPAMNYSGNSNGEIKICKSLSGNTTTTLVGVASGGEALGTTYGPVTSTCSSNCLPIDNNSLPCPAWRDSVFITASSNVAVNFNTIIRTTLNIDHNWFSDLDIWLVGPNNCGTLDLSSDNGGTGDDFVNVTITTEPGFPSITTIAENSLGQLPSNATFMAENAINAPPVLTFAGGQGNSSVPNNSGSLYATTPCLGATSYVPNTGLSGCPINGWWKLVVADDWISNNGSMQSWSLKIVQPENVNYQHVFTTTAPGVNILPSGSFTGLGSYGAIASASVTNLPVGKTEVKGNSILGGCASPDKVFTIKVYDRPQYNGYTNCLGGVVLNATLNNANFTGADVGVIQYATTLAGPWTNLNGPITGLGTGAYTYYLRNSASPSLTGSGSCVSGPFTLNLNQSSQIGITVSPNTGSCSATNVTLTATQSGAIANLSYVWSTGTSTNATIAVAPAAITQYCVTATNPQTPGCSDVACITLGTAAALTPTNLTTAFLCNPTRVKLNWNGISTGTYRVRWRSQTNNVWSSYGAWTNAGNALTYTTPTLLPNKKYQFQVRYVCATTPATFSNTVSKTVTTPSCFSGFVADEVQTPILANELVTDIRLYPNPTIGVLKLDIPESYETGIMQVVSLEGKVMFEQKVQIGENSFDLSALPTQMYIVIVKSNQNYWTNRFELLH